MGARARPAPTFAANLRGFARALARPTILDRYVASELVGPFAFGLAAFTLSFAAINILAIGRLVSEEHASLILAIEYFLWQLPQVIVTVVPMAMLLGTLLALGRLSGESELIAMKAGGVGLVRAVAPLLVIGVVVSIAAYELQERVVPFANDQAVYLREDAIKQIGAFGGGQHTVITQLPGGGKQVTIFGAFQPTTGQLLFVTIITYGPDNRPRGFVYSDRGHYVAPAWTFDNASTYRIAQDGSVDEYAQLPHATIDVGEKPSQIQQRAADNNREAMSRLQIKEIIDSRQLSVSETRSYQTTYEEKLARPFASFVFTLFAIPFGLRPTRGGGTGLGFALALAITFVYFVFLSISSAIFSGLPGGYAISTVGAWTPNVIFTAIGIVSLLRAARN